MLGALREHPGKSYWNAVVAFIVFCLASSSVYIANDLIDIEHDRHHPEKSKRAIASGKVKKQVAISIGLSLFILSITLTILFFSLNSLITLLSYFVLQTIYVLYAKHISLIDIAFISSGFVLRVLFGGITVSIQIGRAHV